MLHLFVTGKMSDTIEIWFGFALKTSKPTSSWCPFLFPFSWLQVTTDPCLFPFLLLDFHNLITSLTSIVEILLWSSLQFLLQAQVSKFWFLSYWSSDGFLAITILLASFLIFKRNIKITVFQKKKKKETKKTTTTKKTTVVLCSEDE